MKELKDIIFRIFSALFFIFIFFAPFSALALKLPSSKNSVSESFSLFTFLVNLIKGKPFFQNLPLTILLASLVLLLAGAVFLIISIFLKKISRKICLSVIYILISLYIAGSISCMVEFANTARWFFKLPLLVYICALTAVAFHVGITAFVINSYRRRSTRMNDVIRQTQKSRNSKKKLFISIRTKVLLTILSAIIVILSAFTFFILRDYHSMITESVSNTGRAQAEQAAAVYDSADGMNEKIAKFFDEQRESNKYSNTPYERIDIIITNDSNPYYIETVDSSTKLPDYEVFAYTTGNPSKVDEDEKSISSDKALEYVKRYQNGSYRKEPVYDKVKKTCLYIHPVTFSRKAGQRIKGFSIVRYRTEILMKAYFQTQVFVFTLSAVFLYIVIIITVLLSDFIATPLIYLRANVHESTNQLSSILSGGGKIGYESLDFNDDIKSNDEIGELSVEIKDLVSLIRGVIPYLSNSTLKYADREAASKLSVNKELCFLFTDIRGFTSMCEGRPAKDVVSLLNHYLDLESEIIIKNHGDIDKFVGDEVMAFFAGPRKEYNACKAAMEIRAAMREAQNASLKEGTDYVSMGIGINSGKVIFGSVGSKNRMDFTSIGDTVNLAARLEGVNKAYGSKAIISEAVFEKLNGAFICRELDYITVKGKTEPVRIYEILQKKDDASVKIYEIRDHFEKGLNAYRRQNWDKAEEAFKQCVDLYNDMPSVIFLDRIRHFRKSPPEKNWDGVFNIKIK